MSQPSSTSVDLPRNQVGPNPQHLLVTLLGDYWHGRTVTIPSAALVQLLGEFDISSTSARSTLSRLSRRGIIDLLRDGRNTSYRVRREFLDAGAVRAARILRFGSDLDGPEEWDGRLILVAFSIPDDNRRDREALRVLLRTWGFAPIRDGLWASIRADAGEVSAALIAQGLQGVAAFSSRVEYPQSDDARRAIVDWPLDRIRESYERFVARYEPELERAHGGSVPPTEALVLRTQMMDDWRTLVRSDPDLPRELLPERWPLADARAVFAALYDGLGPLAEIRCRQIVGAYDPALVPMTSHITTSSDLASDAPIRDR